MFGRLLHVVRSPSVLSRVATTCQRPYSSLPSSSAQSSVVKKKDDDMLEAIAFEDLPRAQKRFAKQFEKVNDERIKEMFAKNYKNHIAFTVLILTAVGIYLYTMYAVKQETFLEEIDEEMAMEKPSTHGHLNAAAKASK